eukprot:CAMPEP_0185913750 /NCGR_PEP_ID=MMETSP0924C-20121207/517_1 /TAXON_ID=321610 /ORGANISM="Perkinsus chesapeaki, Strain ATCC PRA-65" /LENGTH=44 /DNA_ID= /DNA_START= /DNA_END= /DNA_ORIENTATION=
MNHEMPIPQPHLDRPNASVSIPVPIIALERQATPEKMLEPDGYG